MVTAADNGLAIGVVVLLVVGLLIAAVLYVVLCVVIARYASRKGQSFVLFLLVGLIVSPLLSGFIALLLRPTQRY